MTQVLPNLVYRHHVRGSWALLKQNSAARIVRARQLKLQLDEANTRILKLESKSGTLKVEQPLKRSPMIYADISAQWKEQRSMLMSENAELAARNQYLVNCLHRKDHLQSHDQNSIA